MPLVPCFEQGRAVCPIGGLLGPNIDFQPSTSAFTTFSRIGAPSSTLRMLRAVIDRTSRPSPATSRRRCAATRARSDAAAPYTPAAWAPLPPRPARRRRSGRTRSASSSASSSMMPPRAVLTRIGAPLHSRQPLAPEHADRLLIARAMDRHVVGPAKRRVEVGDRLEARRRDHLRLDVRVDRPARACRTRRIAGRCGCRSGRSR